MIQIIFSLLYTIIVTIAVVEILVLGYISGFHILVIGGWTIGTVYGIFVNVHLLLQMLFAYGNRGMIRHLRNMAIRYKYNPTVSIISIGYNENAQLLRQHYRSILKLKHPFKRYWFMSDGPSSDPNNTMLQIFREIFPDGEVIELPFILRYASAQERMIWRTKVQAIKRRTKYIFIAQPHADKRRAMYTAIKAVLLRDKPELMITTDSDTRFAPNVVREMSMPFVDTRVGAVTGDVRILNHSKKQGGTFLSFLSSLRYWQAFHLERAAQSMFGVVYCVSGPLGAYRSAVWKEILDDWSMQRFMGRYTTTGDDRCATNYTLRSKGKQFGEAWRVHFTPYTYCETETPTTLVRWLKQQERWSRSFFREAQLTYRWAHKHHTWLTIDMAYHILFPFFLFASILWQVITVMTTGHMQGPLIFLALVLVSGLLRSIYGALLTRRKSHFFLAGYGFLYMAFLLWVKLFALLFVWRNNWGTSTRHNMDYVLR